MSLKIVVAFLERWYVFILFSFVPSELKYTLSTLKFAISRDAEILALHVERTVVRTYKAYNHWCLLSFGGCALGQLTSLQFICS